MIETKWVKILVGVVLLGIGLGVALPVVSDYLEILSYGVRLRWLAGDIIRLVIGGVLTVGGLGICIQSLLRKSSR